MAKCIDVINWDIRARAHQDWLWLQIFQGFKKMYLLTCPMLWWLCSWISHSEAHFFRFQPIIRLKYFRILTLMVEGGWLCPHFFQMVISPWKKGVWRSQILWLFLIHYELAENQKKIHSVLGWSRRSPHALKQHPEAPPY